MVMANPYKRLQASERLQWLVLARRGYIASHRAAG
jgi:hypothetical protein